MKSVIFFLSCYMGSAFALQATVPMTKIEFWNAPERVYENNCYNYATNRETDSFAQPGEASQKEYTELTCKSVYEAASQDLGLMPTEFFAYNGKNDDTLIALVVSPSYDFHWYRRGDDGKWSHKMGGTPATTVDNSDKEIDDPEKADRGDYVDFCGYFKVKNYTSRPDEQNGGFVRIGNMTQLPKEPTSEVVLAQYSGRRNHSIPLREYLANPENAAQLRALAGQIHVAALATEADVRAASKLGSRSVVLRDDEGLIFAKGTRVQIRGAQAIAFYGEMKPVTLKLPLTSTLEQNAIQRIAPVTK